MEEPHRMPHYLTALLRSNFRSDTQPAWTGKHDTINAFYEYRTSIVKNQTKLVWIAVSMRRRLRFKTVVLICGSLIMI